MACTALFLCPTGYFSIFLCTGNNTGVHLTSAWKKLAVPLCTQSCVTAPAACGHTGLSCDVCRKGGGTDDTPCPSRRGDALTFVITVSGAGGSCSAPFLTPPARSGPGPGAPPSAPRRTSLGADPTRGAASAFPFTVFRQGREQAALPVLWLCREGAAMSALGPRGQQNTAGQAAQPRGPRAADKRDPTRGSSQAAGALTAARHAQKRLRKRSGTLLPA